MSLSWHERSCAISLPLWTYVMRKCGAGSTLEQKRTRTARSILKVSTLLLDSIVTTYCSLLYMLLVRRVRDWRSVWKKQPGPFLLKPGWKSKWSCGRTGRQVDEWWSKKAFELLNRMVNHINHYDQQTLCVFSSLFFQNLPSAQTPHMQIGGWKTLCGSGADRGHNGNFFGRRRPRIIQKLSSRQRAGSGQKIDLEVFNICNHISRVILKSLTLHLPNKFALLTATQN